jgi:chemotaxis signal transduction protein
MKLLEKNFLLFEMGGHEFGVAMSQVEEVVPATTVTAVPHSPSFLMGLAAVRGKVMGVINGALRFKLPVSLCKYFMVCRVRGNLTAVAIDRAYEASTFGLLPLDTKEKAAFLKATKIEDKFILQGYEVMQKDESKKWKSAGRRFFEVNVDLFVSDEMASKVGEA